MIRWILQIGSMLGDLVLLVACIMVLVFVPIIGIPLTYVTYKVWRGQGGAIAWTKEGREAFMHNAKVAGM